MKNKNVWEIRIEIEDEWADDKPLTEKDLEEVAEDVAKIFKQEFGGTRVIYYEVAKADDA